MLELITSSKARSLVCLVTMRIRECEMMREIIASDENDTSYEIVFRALKHLELHCLQSLTSFCSGNYTLRFPSLEEHFKGRWDGDIKATVEQLYKEKVGYRGLQHLKFSKFPELIDIWSRNPQEMLDFTILKFLEVCDSNNLRYIFNLSMAFSLGQLRQMEIKRCVESCPDMTSFYMGSKGLECPSLVEIKVTGCSNMTTFVSTFSRDEDKEATIGDEVDNVATFFSDK
ncbi:hypothetical protein Godav_025550, partial [Gossypium davidsonii]|nr:hypothetical protein [Gossypium davidsonii]